MARIQHYLVLALVSTLLLGCNSNETRPDEVETEEQKAMRLAVATLEQGKSQFHSGDYDAAEATLLSDVLWAVDDAALQVEALKYLGFNYCVSDRPTQCRHAFYRALLINPRFRLSNAESTHPLWGPEFQKARNGGKPANGTNPG